jgi:hypothetical protein
MEKYSFINQFHEDINYEDVEHSRLGRDMRLERRSESNTIREIMKYEQLNAQQDVTVVKSEDEEKEIVLSDPEKDLIRAIRNAKPEDMEKLMDLLMMHDRKDSTLPMLVGLILYRCKL